MERTEESQSGYPEEAPPGAAPDQPEHAEDSPQRQGGRASGDEPGDDGTATGNDAGEPLSADHEPAETEGAPGGAGPGNPPQREQPGL
jgi:hypothetical protein